MDDQPRTEIEEWLERARAGSDEDRERLLAACRNYLQMLARVQVEPWMQAKADASDLVQQTLLDAHRDFARFDGRTAPEWFAWLRRILKNNTGDLVRQYRSTDKRQVDRERAIHMPGDDSLSGPRLEPQAPDATPSQQAVRRESELQVADALADLPADYQQVIVLRNLQRLPFEEVAEKMGRTRPAVQMLWMRAIRKLQEKLEP